MDLFTWLCHLLAACESKAQDAVTFVFSRTNNHHFTTSAMLHFKIFLKQTSQVLLPLMFTTSDLHSWTAPLVMHCLELSKRKNFGSKNLFLKYFLKTFIFTELYFIVKLEFSHHAPKLAIQKKCFVPRFLIWGYVQNQNYIFSCSTPSQPITDF